MIASASIAAELGPDGSTDLTRLYARPPIGLRPGRRTRGSALVRLVARAAGPLGGDRVTVTVSVGRGASLRIESVGATLALPGRVAATSVTEVTIEVADGGTLDWLVDPVIAAAGAHHVQRTRIRAERGARIVWLEEVVAGRFGETAGRVDCRVDVDHAGAALLRHGTLVGGPGWDSPSVAAGARSLCSVLVVDEEELAAVSSPDRSACSWRAAGVRLDGPAGYAFALEDDLSRAREALAGPLGSLSERAGDKVRERWDRDQSTGSGPAREASRTSLTARRLWP